MSWGTYVAVGNLCAYNGIVERQLVEEFAAVAERIAIARGTEKYYREGLQSGRRIPILRQPHRFGGYYDRHPNLDQSVCYDIKVPMANFVWEAKKAGWDKP